jgi:pyridinium-3,5-bisthiocarboxylic acid mononucleotide nickel chelatase
VTALVLDPVGGIAGDMLIAALLHLGAPQAALDAGLRRLGLADAAVDVHEVEVSGIRALHVTVRTPAEPHPHRPWREIRDRIAKARLPPRAEALAQSAFARLAAAEGRIHGVAEEEVEFHEVGAVDSIVDVVGAALLVDALGAERILSLPPPSGRAPRGRRTA